MLLLISEYMIYFVKLNLFKFNLFLKHDYFNLIVLITSIWNFLNISFAECIFKNIIMI